jgi:hypothetical protein
LKYGRAGCKPALACINTLNAIEEITKANDADAIGMSGLNEIVAGKAQGL